jgi:hypothetical protein
MPPASLSPSWRSRGHADRGTKKGVPSSSGSSNAPGRFEILAKEAFDNRSGNALGGHVHAGNVARDGAVAQGSAMIEKIDA